MATVNAALIVLCAAAIVVCLPSAPPVSGDSCTTCPDGPDTTVCILTSVVDEAVVEECRVIPGSECDESTAATTCTLTAQQLNADGDVIDGTGTCNVATGSGRCDYIAPVAEVEGSCSVSTGDDGAASGTGSCEYNAPVSADLSNQAWALILQLASYDRSS